MMQIRKLMALGCAAAMLFATAGCQGKDPQGEQEKFDAFIEQEFVDAMEGNYVNAHVYMQDPESFRALMRRHLIKAEKLLRKTMMNSRALIVNCLMMNKRIFMIIMPLKRKSANS